MTLNLHNITTTLCGRMSGTVLWSKEDDIKLWALRTKPTSQVSMCFRLRSIFANLRSSERRFLNVHSEYYFNVPSFNSSLRLRLVGIMVVFVHG
jgi:hypothetical protein